MVTVGVATLMSAVNAPAFADQPAPGAQRAAFAETIDFGEPPTASLSDVSRAPFPCGGYINQGPSTDEVITTWSGAASRWTGACPPNSVAIGTQSGIGFKPSVNQIQEVEKDFQMAAVSRYNNVISGGGSNPRITGKLHLLLQKKDVVCTWLVIETDNRPGDVPDPVTIDCGGTIEPFTSANGKKYELDLRGFREGTRDAGGNVTCQPTNPLIQTWQTLENATTGACLFARLVGVPQQLEVKKTVDKATAQYGDVVTYTVTGTNTGTQPLNPATITDDMTKVMDAAEITGVQSATIDGQPADPPSYDANTKKLTWSGNLAVGQKVEITYRVRTKKLAGSDDQLDNVITAPDSNCANGTAADCKTNTKITEVPLKVKKAVSKTTAEADDTVTYTVEVENPGNARDEVEVVDDMTAVLDAADVTGTPRATVNGTATTSVATFDAANKRLTWKGPLAAGAKLVLTYDVKIKNPLAGDKKLDNVVKVTGSNCEAGTAPECKTQVTTIETPLKVKKVVDRTTAESDDIVKYTVEVENPGAGRASVTVTDDLSKVLDAADFDGTPSATVDGAPAGTATFDAAGQKLTWTGPLARGKKLLLTYQVKVKNPASGDKLLDNKIGVPDSNCADGSTDPLCKTNVRIIEQPLKVTKSVGQKVAGSRNAVAYTIVVENPGAARSVTVTDDLTEVLDAASLTGTPSAQVNGAPAAAPVYDRATKKLTWTGPLAKGARLTITYTVTTGRVASGDKALDNGVTVPGSNCETAAADPKCKTTVPIAEVTMKKSGRPDTPRVGQKYFYTITLTNTGKVDLVGGARLKATDNLTDVVDDANYNNDARVVSGPAGRLSFTAGTTTSLNWEGDLRVGESVNITYSVTVKRRNLGNMSLNNSLSSTYDLSSIRGARRADEVGKDSGICENGEENCETTGGIAYLQTAKSASPAKVKQGEKVTYTWTLTSTGKADVQGDPAFDYVVDAMPGILKYAEYNKDVKVEGPGTVTFEEGKLKWTGPLKKGEKAVVTFSVTVRKDALKSLTDKGGATMTNTVNSEYNCWPGDPNEPPENVCSAKVRIVPPNVIPPKPKPKPDPCSHKPGAKNPCKKPHGHKPGHKPMSGATGQLAQTGGDTDSLLAIGGVSGLLLLGGGLTLVAARRRNH
ncbi:hypothetical protein GCM10010329_15560 [Streptomyces spiroverticillatus]|uniref:DUF7927 domain-containing protein n=1 Tax=Streptomyces finlayi TaxID=67296 RepID=UPI001673B3BD|nr:isopeptide-forming domain-containing fimbrial protein [Streptomyces finlayi]GGZ94895.1 hypothetical protein GCM10010329_15560 [Streptomyces spiroverticillatus]